MPLTFVNVETRCIVVGFQCVNNKLYVCERTDVYEEKTFDRVAANSGIAVCSDGGAARQCDGS